MSSLTDRLASFGFSPTQRRAKRTTFADSPDKRPTTGATSSTSGDVGVIVRCRPPLGRSETTFALAAEAGQDKVSLTVSADEGAVLRQFQCNTYCGPTARQEDVFEATTPIIDRTMEGYNGTIFCYGVTGSGKTYTMSGPPEEIGSTQRAAESVGIVQRVSTRIFEYIRDRSSSGEVYSVEVSFLEIYSSDGTREQLVDLLSNEEKHLEVKQDPQTQQGFFCDGLRRVSIRTPDEMCEVLHNGQQRLTLMETSANCYSSRSHCIVILSVECLMEQAGKRDPIVQRGKLMLVDLAGSESVKKVQAMNDQNEALRRKQAIGINRVLSSLTTVVNNMNRGLSSGHRGSALTMLLRDCLGGNSRALLVATIGPELSGLDESLKTLTFAQNMMSVKNVASVNRIGQDQSALMQMRQRHADCIRLLEDKASEAKDEEAEEFQNLKNEMDDLGTKLLTKESAEQTLEDIRKEQFKKIDEMRDEMAQTMKKELDQMRQQSLQDLDTLRQSVEKHVAQDGMQQSSQAEEHEAHLGKMQAELQNAVRSKRSVEEEASELRVRLAAAEERSKMLQLRQEELRNERGNFDEERKSLRQQSDQQWQKLRSGEGDAQKYKAEVEVQRAELGRLNAGRAEDAEQARIEHEARRAREAELQQEIGQLHRKLEEAKRKAEVRAIRAETERREACTQLRSQIERLEVEGAAQAEPLSSARKLQAQLEAECEEAKQRVELLRQQGAFELKQCQDELEEATGREEELMRMLDEVQEGIISASESPAPG